MRDLLEPLQATFGRLAIRSSYRSPAVNAHGNAHGFNCAANQRNFARHIWDRRSERGIGAVACIVIPWLVDRMADGTSWQAMAWWVHDHLPYSELQFFPKLAAFNLGWHEVPRRTIYSFIPPRGYLTRPGFANHDGNHGHQYKGVSAFGPVAIRRDGAPKSARRPAVLGPNGPLRVAAGCGRSASLWPGSTYGRRRIVALCDPPRPTRAFEANLAVSFAAVEPRE